MEPRYDFADTCRFSAARADGTAGVFRAQALTILMTCLLPAAMWKVVI